jgi:CRP/FNR family transcriptional regulator, cyclic AMP receptor protein
MNGAASNTVSPNHTGLRWRARDCLPYPRPALNLGTLLGGAFVHKSEAVRALKESKLFSGLLAAQLQALEQTAQLKSYKAGDRIFEEGQPGDGLYIVVNGEVAISTLIGGNRSFVLANAGPGDFFGEVAALVDQPRPTTATAVRDTEAYLVPQQDLLALLGRWPDLTLALLQEINQRIRDLDQRCLREMVQVELLTLIGRLAESIIQELNVPLAIICDSTEVVTESASTSQMRLAAKDQIFTQVDRMTALVSQLLVLSQGAASSSVLDNADCTALVKSLIVAMRSDMATQ